MYGMDAEVGFALSQDGVEWERAELIIESMKWASLFVYRDQLYLMGTQVCTATRGTSYCACCTIPPAPCTRLARM